MVPPQRSPEFAVSSFMRSRRARGPGKLPTPHQPHPKPGFTGNASAEQGDATCSEAAGLKYDGSNEKRYANQVIFHIAFVQSTKQCEPPMVGRSNAEKRLRAGPDGEVEGRPTAPLERRERTRFSRARGACGSRTPAAVVRHHRTPSYDGSKTSRWYSSWLTTRSAW